MTNIGDSFGWAFKDPQWFTKFLLIGLIALIPIVGQINLYGWMLACADNLRRGYPVLPEAGFQYISRGLNLFVVLFVYGLIVAIPLVWILISIFSASLATSFAYPNASPALGIFGSALFPVIQLLGLVLALLTPAIIVATEHGGISGGLSVVQVIESFFKRPGPALLAGVVYWVAGLIGGLGILACCVGIVVTIPYAYSVIGGVVTVYERELGLTPPWGNPPPVAPPPPPPAPVTS